jgi:hypothetical protein
VNSNDGLSENEWAPALPYLEAEHYLSCSVS